MITPNTNLPKELPTPYQQFIYLSRYSRWLPNENRRETFDESITRYFDFMEDHLEENHKYTMPSSIRSELEDAVGSLNVLPSMRALMTAGPALKRCNVAGFNCAYLPIDSARSFDEMMYVLMCGAGVGFSVERQYVNKLPVVNEHFEKSSSTIVVDDSKAGWARALRELISMLYAGQIPKYDTTKVRPAGSILKTFGGRASGPEPLIELFEFIIRLFQNARGRKLTSIECHDICCMIAKIVVVGGVRRSALISLSNLSDDRMRGAKSGQWWEKEPQRALANNSYALTEHPEMGVFMDEWKSLYESKSGERGIFSRYGAVEHIKKHGRREYENIDFGANPCCEILLRPFQFCNLTSTTIRSNDSEKELLEKVRLSSILGTYQSTLTNFKYLRKIWSKNTEEERLLGVSLGGIMDNDITNTRANKDDLKIMLGNLKNRVIETNKVTADDIGISHSVSTTTVKPEGTTSQMVDARSGIHAGYSGYYVRTVRGDNKDPLTQMLKEAGVPNEPCISNPENTTIFSFPIKTPDSTVLRDDITSIEHLEHWLLYRQYWAEHTVSITADIRDDEWLDVAAWVWKNLDEITGISFLPYSNHVYRQAPYQPLDKEDYDKLVAKMPDIDWNELKTYEKYDTTTGAQELACSGGACEIVDIGK